MIWKKPGLTYMPGPRYRSGVKTIYTDRNRVTENLEDCDSELQ